MLLGAVLLAGLIWLLVRAMRRRGWDSRFAVALVDARWVATDLTGLLLGPTLTPDGATLAWTENQPRIQGLHDELTALGAAKPDDRRGARVDRVSSDLTSLTESISALVALRGAVADSPDAGVTLEQARAAVENRSRSLQDAIDDRPAPGAAPTAPGSSGATS